MLQACKKHHVLRAAVLILTALFLCALPFMAAGASPAEDREPEYKSFDEINGKTVGLLTGAPFEDLVRSKAPKVKEFQYFSSMADMEMALKAGKIDALFMNNAVSALAVNRDEAFAIMPGTFYDSNFGMAFKKGSPEKAKWEAAYAKVPQKTRDEIFERWTGSDESKKKIPEQDWPGKNGTVQIASCDTLPPLSYRSDHGEIVGIDVETVLLIAKELDVHVEFTGMEFGSIMPSIESGKMQVGAGSIVITDERAEVVDFVPYCPASFVLMVRSAKGGANAGFWAGLKSSFIKTFVKEHRYQMVLSGLGLTVLISVCAGALGLLLAFALIFLRHRDNKVANKIIAAYESLIAGIPAVVILMVFYYLVFGKVQLPAVIVAIIGFSLIFGARAYGTIRTAITGVDAGQQEAALALGYTESHCFREVILPQAVPRSVPILQAQFVTLIKETSVAGFITVLELTRAGDLIRSSTMEAFFPLISIALIYYLLTRVLLYIVRRQGRKSEAKRELRRIKGVDDNKRSEVTA